MPNVATIVSGLRKAISDPKDKEIHLVEQPIDAYQLFLDSDVDLLVINDRVWKK